MIKVLFNTEEGSRMYEAANPPTAGDLLAWLAKELVKSEFVRVKTQPGLQGYTFLRVRDISLIRVVEVQDEEESRA